MAHVFIVDDTSFKTHLENLFAGTGAKEYDATFLNNSTDIQPSIERLLVSMIADVSRIRPDDDIIFYLQQSKKHEGMFFGGFKAVGSAFLSDDDYLKEDLGKKLIFRIQIVPDKVYSVGVTERECLDSLENINKPYEMCWSLIYRKLKANRGCTMITDREYNLIMNKIRQKNDNILNSDNGLTFDSENQCICEFNSKLEYSGVKKPLDIFNRLLYKYKKNNSFEAFLQAYILQNLENIKPLHINSNKITWIGNEVSCGVGMQSIDIAFIQSSDDKIDLVICELKDEQIVDYIENQLYKYINWIKDYIAPTYDIKIFVHPTIVAPKPNKKAIEIFKRIKSKFKGLNKNMEVTDVRYISFELNDSEVLFKEESV